MEEEELHAWQTTQTEGVLQCTYKINQTDFPYGINQFTLRYSYAQDTVSLTDVENRKVCLNVSVGYIRARDTMSYQAYGELVFRQIENILAGKPVDISLPKEVKLSEPDIKNIPIREGSYISFRYSTKNILAIKINRLTISFFCKRCNTLNMKSVGEESEIEKDVKSTFNCVKCTGSLSVECTFHLLTGENTENMMGVEYTGIYNMNIRYILFNCVCSNCSRVSTVETDREFHCPCGSTLLLKKDPARPYKEISKIKEKQKKSTQSNLNVNEYMKSGGACEHYKKSSRIFIFPCCNGRYPCDICHNKHETHKAERAARMVCGKCGIESAVSTECSACKISLTGKTSSFWEGGKGSRNKLTMSRKDSKKYSK